MSTLRILVERLRRGVIASSPERYRRAAAKHPALAGHADLPSVLVALSDESEAAYPMREAVTAALLAEHRETREEVWASVLVLAYYPMLSRLRHRLVSTTLPRDELDQVVITAFLAAVGEVPVHLDRMPMRLRQRTERAVFSFLRKEWSEYQPPLPPEELARVAIDSADDRRSASTREGLVDLARLLERAEANGLPTAGLDVVEATVLGKEMLRAYVERLVPGDAEERERVYQRLKRQRSRAMKRLKSLVRVSPTPEVAGL